MSAIVFTVFTVTSMDKIYIYSSLLLCLFSVFGFVFSVAAVVLKANNDTIITTTISSAVRVKARNFFIISLRSII